MASKLSGPAREAQRVARDAIVTQILEEARRAHANPDLQAGDVGEVARNMFLAGLYRAAGVACWAGLEPGEPSHPSARYAGHNESDSASRAARAQDRLRRNEGVE